MSLAAKVWLALGCGLASVCSAQEAGERYRLYPSSDSGDAGVAPIGAVVPPDGRVRLLLERPAKAPSIVNLTLSEFGDEQGNRMTVAIRFPDDTGAKTSARRSVAFHGAFVALSLDVDSMVTSGPYSGFLFLLRSDTVLARFRITLHRVPAAKLVLDRRDTIILTTTRSFTVHLYEASREHALEGVFVRLLEVHGTRTDFDPTRQLAFDVNGQAVDLWSAPRNDSGDARLRRIPRGEPLAVLGVLRDMAPGEYQIKLRFLALNSLEDPQQVLSLTVRVRHPPWLAIVVLVIGIGVSYVGTKWLKTRFVRLQFWSKLDEQERAWLRDEPPVLPVVWVRTIFRLAQDLARRTLLSGMDVIDARVKQANVLVPRLDRLRRVRGRINALSHRWLARRAEKARQHIIGRLSSGALDEQSAAEIDAALTDLEAWFAPDQLEAHYWTHLKKDIDALIAGVKPDLAGVPDPAKSPLTALVTDLETHAQTEPKGLDAKIDCERMTYATLKVLWERYGKPGLENDFNELIRLHDKEKKRGQDLLDAADEMAWTQLQKAATVAGGIYFASPHRDSGEPWESYEPLLFEVKPRNPAIGDNYLFKHKGLTYEWHITLNPSERFWRKKPHPSTLHPITSEPRVVQYVPRGGSVAASVAVRRDTSTPGFEVQYGDGGLVIKESRDFNTVKAFETVEILALALILVVAGATGISTLYLDNATFGSLQDYLKLFLWGVGADQIKNVLQVFQTFSTASGPTSGG